MKILCVTDQEHPETHSAIQGIFGGYLRKYCTVDIVSFSRELTSPARQAGGIALPYRQRGRSVTSLSHLLDLSLYDLVVVRNYFAVLDDFLRHRCRFGYRLGFWNSFPHTYRRLFQAQLEGRALWRKRIEYLVTSWREKKLLARCDFMIAMSPSFKASFYPDLHLPYYPLPMGVDCSNLPQRVAYAEGPPVKMIYTGTVDSLRRTGEVIESIATVEGDFHLDIFTQSINDETRRIATIADTRIALRPPLPRNELFQRMVQYDLGIGLVPENKLYNVSSPTKTLEYYALGIPSLINYLPEYQELFSDNAAFFCEFSPWAIKQCLSTILKEPRSKLRRMGKIGQEAVLAKRDYQVMAKGLFAFLGEIVNKNRGFPIQGIATD